MFLGMYIEYGSNNGISMKDHFNSKPYEGQERIVAYLKGCGTPTMARMKRATDRISGEPIEGLLSLELLTDGKFEWYNDLAFHVEKYNLRLPREFEEYVLNRP